MRFEFSWGDTPVITSDVASHSVDSPHVCRTRTRRKKKTGLGLG